jgi:hypothetical protein
MRAKCLRECWDSKATKFYRRGEEADIPEDYILAKNFEFLERPRVQRSGIKLEPTTEKDEEEIPLGPPIKKSTLGAKGPGIKA